MRKLINCFKYDFKEGILRNWYLYLIEIFLLVVFSVNSIFYMNNKPGINEVSLMVFEGMEEYSAGENPILNSFDIPMTYLAFTLVSCLFAASYPKKEWKLRGSQFIRRYESTDTWWFSKVLWSAAQSVFIYVTAFMVIYLAAAIGGNKGFAVRYEMPYNGMLFDNNGITVFLYCYILGAVTMTALNQLIVTLQMAFSPIAGYLAAMSVIILSAYYFTPFLPGNNFMMLRTILFKKDGIAFNEGIITAAVIWIASVLAGKIIVKRKDIL